MARIDYLKEIGKKYNDWLIIDITDQKTASGVKACRCQCKCGSIRNVPISNLKSGTSKSCGCLSASKGKKSAFKVLYYRYKYTASNRNIEFNIDRNLFEELVIQNCHYCGKVPSNLQKADDYSGKHKKSLLAEDLYYNGIDRVENDKGYIEGNIVTCCTECNRAKGVLSRAEFLQHIVNIFKHNKLELND